MKVLAVVFVLLFVLATAASAQAGMGQWGRTWQTIAFTALLLSYFIIGVFYALGVGFSSPRLTAFAKHEFYQTSATAVILGMVIGADAGLNTLFDAFKAQSFIHPASERQGNNVCTGTRAVQSGSWNTIQQQAVSYSDCLVEVNVASFRFLTFVNTLVGFFATINMYFDIGGLGGVSISPFLGFKVLVDLIGYVLSAQVLNLIQLKAQNILLAFARDSLFTLVLPFGVALRSFTITRSAGGALIAIAVGFYIVFPLAYVFSAEIVGEHCSTASCGSLRDNPDWTGVGILDAAIGGSGAPDMVNLFKMGFKMFKAGGAGLDALMDASDPSNFGGGSGKSSFMNDFGANGPLGSIVYMGMIASGVLPIFSLIITLQFIRNLALLLGADVDFSALVKII